MVGLWQILRNNNDWWWLSMGDPNVDEWPPQEVQKWKQEPQTQPLRTYIQYLILELEFELAKNHKEPTYSENWSASNCWTEGTAGKL